MEREGQRDWVTELSSDSEVRRLVRALTLSSRFHFYLLITNAVLLADAVLEILRRDLSVARGGRARLVRLDPYRAQVDARAPLTKEVLAVEVLERLIDPADGDHGAIHVIDASKAAPADDEAWAWLFQRMNERRNLIRQRHTDELLLTLPPRLEVLFAHSAPDLWSIRSGEFRVTPKLVEPAAPRRVAVEGKGVPEAEDELEASLTPSGFLDDAEPAASERMEPAEREFEDASTLRARAVLLAREADALMEDARFHLDNFKRRGAYQALSDAVALRRRLAELAPEHPEATYDLAESLHHLGDVAFKNADLHLAMGAYEESLALMRRLVERDPKQAEWLRNLSVSLDRVGDVQRARGELDRAQEAYEESLSLRRRLLSRDPERAEWLRALAVSLNKVGDVQGARGELERAQEAYEESLSLTRRLHSRDPERVKWLRDLAVSLDRVGDVQGARGELDRAQESHEESLALKRRLLSRDPERAEWLRDLAVSLDNVGDVQGARGELDRAQEAYEEALSLRRRLLSRDPERAEWLRDLAVSLSRVGDVQRERGELECAQEAYEESLALIRRLLSRDPTRPQWVSDNALLQARLDAVRQARAAQPQKDAAPPDEPR